MRIAKPQRRFFVYRTEDHMQLTNPVKSEAAARRTRANLQKHFSHELAIGWHVLGQDGKPKNTEYPT